MRDKTDEEQPHRTRTASTVCNHVIATRCCVCSVRTHLIADEVLLVV